MFGGGRRRRTPPHRAALGFSTHPLLDPFPQSAPSYITHASPDATPSVRGVTVSPGARAPGARVVLRGTPFFERGDREVEKEAAYRRELRLTSRATAREFR